ncbi:MAG: sulfite exporter TauE/SafE family protein [Candidatus Firestonebacteria bacterium]
MGINMILIVGGFVAGILSGLLGVGGGVILVPFLSFLGMSFHQAIGTSLICILPTVFIGSMKHYQLGNVDWLKAIPVSVGAIGGAYIGAVLTNQISDISLKRIFAIFFIIIGIKMLFEK